MNITIQFENRGLQFQLRDGLQRSIVHLLGCISTMTHRPVATFEKPLEIDAPPELLRQYGRRRSIYQQSFPWLRGIPLEHRC